MTSEVRMKKIVIIAAIVLLVALIISALFIFVIPMKKYQHANELMASGNYMQAAAEFANLEDYKDSAKLVLKCKYLEADRLEKSDRKAAAAMAFGAISDYSDARERSFRLWDDIAIRPTYEIGSYHAVAIQNDGSVLAQDRVDDSSKINTTVSAWQNVISVQAGRFHCFALCSDGTVLSTRNNDDCLAWTDIVSIYVHTGWDGDTLVGLKADGTVLYQPNTMFFENQRGQDNVSAWRNIVAVSCTDSHTVGLRSNGTVIAIGDNAKGQCNTESWTDIIAIATDTEMTIGLRADGTLLIASDSFPPESSDVKNWSDLVAIEAHLDSFIGMRSDGTLLYSGSTSNGRDECLTWSDVSTIQSGPLGPIAVTQSGTFLFTPVLGNLAWFTFINDWSDIKLPLTSSFVDLDHLLVFDHQAELNLPDSGFYNAFGTPTTVCAHNGCKNYIAKFGDTNCCTLHSARCQNCYCYIDEDAIYCMKCIKEALK